MVVSIEISGPYEDKLRRLVELGVYASIAEAVRDALRRLMSELEMAKIALQLYVRKGSSIYYFCELAEEPCNKAIEFMLINQVTPRLGHEPGEPVEHSITSDTIILDPSAIIVSYNSLGIKILEKLSNIYNFVIPSELSNFEKIYYALARKHGIKTRFSPAQVNIKPVRPPSDAAITSIEYGIIRYAQKSGSIVLVEDSYTRRIARSLGIKTLTIASLINISKDMISKNEIVEIIFSLRAIPYLIPVELEEELLK